MLKNIKSVVSGRFVFSVLVLFFCRRFLIGADVFSPYLGEAEAAVRQAFVLARNAAPALLFFDEIDAIVCKREGGGKASNSRRSHGFTYLFPLTPWFLCCFVDLRART